MLLHPAFVHLPIAFALFAAPLAVALFLLGRRFAELRRLWIVLVLWHLLLSASIYAAMFTGEMAEEAAQAPDRRPAAGLEAAIETHEGRAELFFLLSLLGVPLAVWGVKAKNDLPRFVLIAFQILLLGLCVYVGYLGGQIRHGVEQSALHNARLDR